MQVAVIGCGYVGLATSVVLADLGHNVVGVEINPSKLELLSSGKSHIYETHLQELLERCVNSDGSGETGMLSFTDNHAAACENASVIMLAVGTPTRETWQIDLSQLESAIDSVANALNLQKNNDSPGPVIVVKSTVPSGTMDYLKERLAAQTDKAFRVASNPEFLREGQAIYDTFYPDRIVIGIDDESAFDVMKELYSELIEQDFSDDLPRPARPEHQEIPVPVVKTTPRSAEMIKYASNAFLATKISFINEIANLCEEVDADISDVARGIGLDTRIGPQFLRAGIGYGGSCFPKDTKALHQHAGSKGYTFTLLNAVIEVNRIQRYRFLAKIRRALEPLQGKTIGILGLAFKPGTDDIREAPAIDLMRELQMDRVRLKATDPKALENAKEAFSECEYMDDPYDVAKDADAIIIVTEWTEFRTLDWAKIAELMKGNIVFDGRNCLDRSALKEAGLHLIGVGR